MIFITGDCHSEFHKFNMASFPEQMEMTRDDYVIICGDFGGVWDWKAESKYERFWLQWLEEKNYTTLFVDGNHENFERLQQYPEKEWKGGHVHEIRPHLLHLMRGYVFEIDGISIFTFGGAESHDIKGGIFEPDDPRLKRKLELANEIGEPYRINHRSWWKEELPEEAEKARGIANLEAHGNKVDLIVTHDCASSLQPVILEDYHSNHLNDYLEEIRNGTDYRYWFFGHYHADSNLTERDIVLYDQIIRIF